MPYEIRRASGAKPFCVYKQGGAKIACHPTRAKAVAQMRALYAQEATMDASERTYTADQRREYAQKGIALSDGSYPIPDRAALMDAIHRLGTAKANDEYARVKRHIIKRARALKAMDALPPDWNVGASESYEGPVRERVQVLLPAAEVAWADNADGLPQADVVIIRPGESANRRFYSKEAIADAVKRDFWGGTPMFIDHGDTRMPRKRSVRDLAARIEPGTTYVGTEGEARAKTTFINTDFAKFARAAGSAMGLSAVHEFMGQRYRGGDGHYHERVDKFVVNHSVDFVAFPAAGGEVARFLPAQESEDDVDWTELTPEMLKEHRPDLVDDIVATAAESDEGGDDDDEDKDEGDDKKDEQPTPEGVVTLAQARKIATEAAEHVRDEYVERERKTSVTRSAVAAHLAKSGLPERTRTRIAAQFEGQTEYIEKTVQEAIDGAAEELKDGGWRGPVVRGLGNSAAESGNKSADPDTLKQLYPTMMAVEEQMSFVPRTGKKGGAAAGKAN